MYYVTAHRRRYVQRALLRKRGHVVQQLLHRAQQVLRAAVGAADLAVAHQQTQLQEQRVDALLARRRRRVEGRRRQVARGGRREERVGEEAVQQLLGFAGFGGVGGVGGILSCIGNTLRCISNTLRCISNTLCTLLRSILHITRCHCTQSLSLLLSLGCFLRLLRSTQRLLLLLRQILVRFLLRSDFCHSPSTCNQTLLRRNVSRLACRLRDRFSFFRRQLCLHFGSLLRLLRSTQRLLLLLRQILVRFLLRSDFCHSPSTCNQTLLRRNVSRLACRLRDRFSFFRRQLCLHFGSLLRLLRSTQRLLLLLCQILVRFLLGSDFYTRTIHSCAPSFVISCVMAGSGWFISTHQCDCLSEPVTASCCSFSAFLACTDAAFAAFFALRSACFSSCVKFLFASCCARIAKRDTEVPFLTLLLCRLGINATFLRNLHSDAFDEWKGFL